VSILHVFMTRGLCESAPVYVYCHVTPMYESLITTTRRRNQRLLHKRSPVSNVLKDSEDENKQGSFSGSFAKRVL